VPFLHSTWRTSATDTSRRSAGQSGSAHSSSPGNLQRQHVIRRGTENPTNNYGRKKLTNISRDSIANMAARLRRERWRSIVMSTSVCLSVCQRAYLRTHTRDHYHVLCMSPMAVARSSSDRVTKSQGKGAILVDFLPTDNTL